MSIRVLATSGDSWSGVSARLYDVGAGTIESPPSRAHGLAMLVGSPVVTSCRCEGRVSRALQLPGELHFIPARYACTWKDEGATRFLDIDLDTRLLDEAADACAIAAPRFDLAPQLHVRDLQLEHLCRALLLELEGGAVHGPLYGESLGSALAAHVVRRCAGRGAGEAAYRHDKRRLRPVLDYIDAHLEENLSLHELAEVARMSGTHLKYLFRRSLGTPVHRYVLEARVRRAVRLLEESDVALSEIALSCGFADQSHMSGWVRRLAGRTPAALRRHAR